MLHQVQVDENKDTDTITWLCRSLVQSRMRRTHPIGYRLITAAILIFEPTCSLIGERYTGQ